MEAGSLALLISRSAYLVGSGSARILSWQAGGSAASYLLGVPQLSQTCMNGSPSRFREAFFLFFSCFRKQKAEVLAWHLRLFYARGLGTLPTALHPVLVEGKRASKGPVRS